MSIASKIEKIAAASAAAWEMAVDTAGPDYSGGSEARATAMQDLADECAEAYEAAESAVLDGDLLAAESEIERARALEAEGGDDCHARDAAEALAEGVVCPDFDDVADLGPGVYYAGRLNPPSGDDCTHLLVRDDGSLGWCDRWGDQSEDSRGHVSSFSAAELAGEP